MGWNDRLPEDPYIPSDAYYEAREEYEAWLEYVEMRFKEESRGLTSQNLDPAMLVGSQPAQEPPARQNFLSRIWAMIFDKKRLARRRGARGDPAGTPNSGGQI